jgi:sulfoxide reductase heme-binding subunit YedZ
MTLSLFSINLALVHAGGQLSTGNGPVGLIDEFVPFLNKTDPLGIGFGTLALEIMLALLISVPLQRKLGYHRWRGMHALAYASFTMATAHLLISGAEVSPIPSVAFSVLGLWLMTVVVWAASTFSAGNKVPKVMGGEKLAAARASSKPVTVNVDPSHCVRFGFCEHEAPEVFQLRNDGRLTYKAQVPQDQVEAVISAAQICPARAIKLSRIPTTVVMSGSHPAVQARKDDTGNIPRQPQDTGSIPRAARRADRGAEPTRLSSRRGRR